MHHFVIMEIDFLLQKNVLEHISGVHAALILHFAIRLPAQGSQKNKKER